MTMTALQEAISKIYWRNIKNGNRKFADIEEEEVRGEVKRLAGLDVENGKITADQYEQYIGEVYVDV